MLEDDFDHMILGFWAELDICALHVSCGQTEKKSASSLISMRAACRCSGCPDAEQRENNAARKVKPGPTPASASSGNTPCRPIEFYGVDTADGWVILVTLITFQSCKMSASVTHFLWSGSSFDWYLKQHERLHLFASFRFHFCSEFPVAAAHLLFLSCSFMKLEIEEQSRSMCL